MARRKLKNLIYQMLEDYTEGDKPTRQDLWAVLEGLGTPSEVGRQIFNHYYLERKEFLRKAKRLAALASRVLYGISLALVILGIGLLAFGREKTALPLVLAVLCGGIGLALQVAFPGLYDKTYPESDAQR